MSEYRLTAGSRWKSRLGSLSSNIEPSIFGLLKKRAGHRSGSLAARDSGSVPSLTYWNRFGFLDLLAGQESSAVSPGLARHEILQWSPVRHAVEHQQHDIELRIVAQHEQRLRGAIRRLDDVGEMFELTVVLQQEQDMALLHGAVRCSQDENALTDRRQIANADIGAKRDRRDRRGERTGCRKHAGHVLADDEGLAADDRISKAEIDHALPAH